MKSKSDTWWQPPGDWPRVHTVDAHTEGEPFRVILSGVPEIPGVTMIERRSWAVENLDQLRTGLMFEPRGHADMYGCIVTPPSSQGSDFGVLFLHNEGFSTMCGHGIIGVTTVLLETEVWPITSAETELRIDTPAGLVVATAQVRNKRVTEVRFRNVPSFVASRGHEIDVPGYGSVAFDLAFGGAFYAYVEACDLSLVCRPEGFRPLIEAGRAIKRAILAHPKIGIEHPFEEELGFLYGVVFVDRAEESVAHSRNVCVFADGEVDRSPTGTSVSARLALLHEKGEIQIGEEILIESILGTSFSGRVIETTTFGPHAAVVPEVGGTAHITGQHEFVFDPDDPLRAGFLLR